VDNGLAPPLDTIRHLGRTVDGRIGESTGPEALQCSLVDIPHGHQQKVHRIRVTLWICFLAGMGLHDLRCPPYAV